jgi:hypothetical protein
MIKTIFMAVIVAITGLTAVSFGAVSEDQSAEGDTLSLVQEKGGQVNAAEKIEHGYHGRWGRWGHHGGRWGRWGHHGGRWGHRGGYHGGHRGGHHGGHRY